MIFAVESDSDDDSCGTSSDRSRPTSDWKPDMRTRRATTWSSGRGRLATTGKQLSAFLGYSAKSPRPWTLPVHYHVEVTSRCNLRCPCCPYSLGHAPQGGWGHIDTTLFTRLIREIERSRPSFGISLHVGGEPLLHPKIGQLVRIVHEELGMMPMFASNGLLLTDGVIRDLVKAGGAMIEVDFSSEIGVFQRFRGSVDWAAVRSNIQRALDAGLGLCIRSYDGDTKPLRDLFRAGSHLTILPFRLHNVGGDFAPFVMNRFGPTPFGHRFHPCSHLWFGMSIAWNGNVVLCCRDVLHSQVIGDLTMQSIRDVWYGEAFAAIRRQHVERRLQGSLPCHTCDRPWDCVNAPWSMLVAHFFPRR